MLMHTREGITIVTQREKLKRKPENRLFILKALLCSIPSVVDKASLVNFATGSFRTGQAKLSQAHFYSIHFLKVRHFPGKIDNKPLPGVFLEASFPLQQTFKIVLRPIFIWRGTSRDFFPRLAASRPKKLAPLANDLVKLGSFNGFSRSFVIF